MDGDVSMTTEQAAKKLKGESGEAKSKKNKKKNKKEQKDEAESATNGQEASTSPEKAADDKKKKGGAAELKDLGEGLKVKDVKVGSGKQAKPGNTILMRWRLLSCFFYTVPEQAAFQIHWEATVRKGFRQQHQGETRKCYSCCLYP